MKGGIFFSKNEKEDKVRAGITTAVSALLILLFLIFVGFKGILDEADGGGGGVEVQMGDPNQGGPDDSPLTEKLVPVQPQHDEVEDNFNTNQEDGVAINQKDNKKKPEKKTEKVEEKEPEQKISDDLADLFKSSKDSKGQGTGANTGTQGQKDGTGSSTTGGGGGTGDGSGSGSGVGPGSGFSLGQGFGNRKISRAPTARSTCTNAKGGKVVFKVEVNPQGKVVRVFNPSTGERGTNVSDPCLMNEAVDLVKKVELTASTGSINTIGEITITIKN